MFSAKLLVRNIFIILPLLIILVIFTSFKLSKSPEFVSGYVPFLSGSSGEKYKESMINYYDPEPGWKFGEQFGTSTQPEIAGESGFLIDLSTGKILFDKNSNQRMKIASLAKIMTAVVALEHKKPENRFYVSSKACSIGENAMGISEGETYTLEELLYGLVLPSGNDAAYAIAEGVAGDSGRFTEWMNFKARELGLNDTYYADPSGLDDSSYSTSRDLVRLTRYALKYPEFKKIVGTVEQEIVGDDHKYIFLQNQTNLLTTYPGVAGVKTGFTEEAGLTLVTYAVNDGKEVVGTVLKSIDRKGDMILMLDHGFSTLGVKVDHPALTF
jgi:D-alanyl-D-alanine carboxypeptidase